MRIGDLEITDGSAAGSWIADRLSGSFGAVTLQVPNGYDAYVRILHPASDSEGNPVRWAYVASSFGKVSHRRMQWYALLGMSGAEDSSGGLWTGDDPPTGEMSLEELDELCKILTAHTGGAEDCYFGLCTIQGWLDSFSTCELRPLLRLPMGRDYIVFAGPLWAVDQISRVYTKDSKQAKRFPFRGSYGSEDVEFGDISRDVPNLIWPSDHSWFVASEVDFDSTLVGGDAKLVEAIVNSPRFEAWQMEPTDSLAADADTLNLVPSGGDTA